MENHFRRSDAAGVNYSRAVYDPVVKTKKENGQLLLVLESEISGVDIHYTLDETMPDNHSGKYSSPVPVPDGPVNLRVQAYRNGVPSGHLITLKRSQLEARAQ
jgi:hexosaminidase